MADYIVSARKYRPTRFRDLVGQEHISSTLQNAIKTNQLAHSFLFCGPRGVGKTTAARILAKTINCENLTADIEACNDCHSCISFNQNSSFNIHELDAASNNSVEDIRQLVEQVRFPPQSGKYKIYIIDEVHMLSSGAFNAFLKTLEEPPGYCKFILATTEKHKILPTILSRCQIFDFRRIKIETIVAHLRHICELEGITAEEDALHIIAQKSDGGMRDSLSMFDRLSSFAGGQLTYKSVLENLNVLDYDYFFKVTDALLTEEMTSLIGYLSEVIKRGFEGDDFILGLCEHFRNLLFAKNKETVELMEVSESLKQRYLNQTALASSSFLINCLSIGNHCDINYKLSKNKRLTVELALIKMCYVNATIEAQIEASKKKVIAPASADIPKPIPSPSPTPAQPKPAQDAGVKKSSKLISIDSIEVLDIVAEPPLVLSKEDINTTASHSTTPLTQALLIEIWNNYAESIKDSRGGLSGLLQGYPPQLTDTGILIETESDTQQSSIAEIVPAIKRIIHQHTGLHYDLVIQTNTAEKTIKYMTPQDKFKRLIELNPAIRRLQKELGLDPDYNE